MAPVIVRTWNLVTSNGIPYTVGITEDLITFLAVRGQQPFSIDPAALSGVLGQVNEALQELQQTICTVTLTLDTDTLTCDQPAGHEREFHHDPRGFYWFSPS